MDDLTLKIGEIDIVVIHHPDMSDTSRRQIHENRRA
jgi:hypothetical protein